MQGEKLACFHVWLHAFMNVCVCAQCLLPLTRAQQRSKKKPSYSLAIICSGKDPKQRRANYETTVGAVKVSRLHPHGDLISFCREQT